MRMFITLILSLSILYSYGQSTGCRLVSLEKLNLENPKSTLNKITKLKPCGLDDLDVKIFSSGPILGTIMVNLANQNKPVKTLGDLLTGINQFKQTQGYRSLRLHPEILNQPVTKNEPVKNFKNTISALDDYDKAVTLSKSNHKPLLIYFNAKYGMNCRRFEDNIMADHQITDFLQNFVIVCLTVDDQTILSKPYKTKIGTLINTIGDKNSYLQIALFKQNSQPFIAVTGIKDCFTGYVSDQDFIKFLQEAKTKWDKAN